MKNLKKITPSNLKLLIFRTNCSELPQHVIDDLPECTSQERNELSNNITPIGPQSLRDLLQSNHEPKRIIELALDARVQVALSKPGQEINKGLMKEYESIIQEALDNIKNKESTIEVSDNLFVLNGQNKKLRKGIYILAALYGDLPNLRTGLQEGRTVGGFQGDGKFSQDALSFIKMINEDDTGTYQFHPIRLENAKRLIDEYKTLNTSEKEKTKEYIDSTSNFWKQVNPQKTIILTQPEHISHEFLHKKFDENKNDEQGRVFRTWNKLTTKQRRNFVSSPRVNVYSFGQNGFENKYAQKMRNTPEKGSIRYSLLTEYFAYLLDENFQGSEMTGIYDTTLSKDLMSNQPKKTEGEF